MARYFPRSTVHRCSKMDLKQFNGGEGPGVDTEQRRSERTNEFTSPCARGVVLTEEPAPSNWRYGMCIIDYV